MLTENLPACGRWTRTARGGLRHAELVTVDTAPVRAEIAHRLDLYRRGLARIESRRDVLSGEPVFKGTRLSVRHIGGMAANGVPVAEIRDDYPGISADDIAFAALYARMKPARPSRQATPAGARPGRRVRVLLDESLLPRLVPRRAAKGVTAQHITHVSRAGMSDADLCNDSAFETDQMVAPLNARDLLLLAQSVELHPGLIVLRTAGLPPDGQWRHLEPVVDFALAERSRTRSGQLRDRGDRREQLARLRSTWIIGASAWFDLQAAPECRRVAHVQARAIGRPSCGERT